MKHDIQGGDAVYINAVIARIYENRRFCLFFKVFKELFMIGQHGFGASREALQLLQHFVFLYFQSPLDG